MKCCNVRHWLMLLLMVSAANARAQIHWQNRDADFAPLPPNFHVYSTTDSLDGKPNIAYYVDVLLKEKSVSFSTQTGNGKRFTPSQFYQQEGAPLLVVNGTFFNFDKNQNLNLVMKDGKLVAYNQPALPMRGKDTGNYYYLTRSAIGIDKHRHADVAWTYTDTAKRWPYALLQYPAIIKGTNPDPDWSDIRKGLNGSRKKLKWKMQTAIGGGPSLLRQGQIVITNNEERMFVGGEADHHPRIAMGYTQDGHLIILAVQGRFPTLAEGATLQQEAQLLQSLGCWEALNLDGGGSSCLLVNGKETIKPSDKEGQRPVPGVFIIKKQ